MGAGPAANRLLDSQRRDPATLPGPRLCSGRRKKSDTNGGGRMAENYLGADWNWNDAEGCTQRLDGIRIDAARCDKIEAIGIDKPFTGRDLRGLGLNGIEFAAFVTQHPSGLGVDQLPVRAENTATESGRIYQLDGQSYFAQLDISQPLPFESSCVEWVYAEHLIEHVPLDVGIGWLAEVRRVLMPGGLLRLTTPDLRKYLRNYLDDDGFFAEHRRRMLTVLAPAPEMPDRPAFMVNQIFSFYGHRWLYDVDELRNALTEAGFDPQAVRVCSFGRGQHEDVAALDRAERSDETLYVEVVR
jgi:predicted SAM-dependent methyltransferase